MMNPEADVEDSEERYPALRTIETALRALGWVILTIGVLASLGAAAGTASAIDDEAASVGGALLVVLSGGALTAFLALVVFAQAELICVLLDIETNTWDAAENTLGLVEERERRQRPVRRRGR